MTVPESLSDFDLAPLSRIDPSLLMANRRNRVDQLFLALVSGLDRVLVTEQHGQLASAWADVPTVQQGDQVFHVIHGTPTSLVWEAGDLVLTASCDCEVSTLVDVATAFPADDEPGVVDRISAGLGQLVDEIIGSD